MAVPTVRASAIGALTVGSTRGTTGALSITPADGDLLLFILPFRLGGQGLFGEENDEYTTGNGWRFFVVGPQNGANSTGPVGYQVYWRIWNTGDPTTWPVWTSTALRAVQLAITGYDPDDPFDFLIGSDMDVISGSNATSTSESADTTTDDVLGIAVPAIASNTTMGTADADWTSEVSPTYFSDVSMAFGCYKRSLTTAGTTVGPDTWTWNASNTLKGVLMLGIRSASDPAPPSRLVQEAAPLIFVDGTDYSATWADVLTIPEADLDAGDDDILVLFECVTGTATLTDPDAGTSGVRMTMNGTEVAICDEYITANYEFLQQMAWKGTVTGDLVIEVQCTTTSADLWLVNPKLSVLKLDGLNYWFNKNTTSTALSGVFADFASVTVPTDTSRKWLAFGHASHSLYAFGSGQAETQIVGQEDGATGYAAQRFDVNGGYTEGDQIVNTLIGATADASTGGVWKVQARGSSANLIKHQDSFIIVIDVTDLTLANSWDTAAARPTTTSATYVWDEEFSTASGTNNNGRGLTLPDNPEGVVSFAMGVSIEQAANNFQTMIAGVRDARATAGVTIENVLATKHSFPNSVSVSAAERSSSVDVFGFVGWLYPLRTYVDAASGMDSITAVHKIRGTAVTMNIYDLYNFASDFGAYGAAAAGVGWGWIPIGG